MTEKPPKPTPNYKRRVLADFGPRQQEFLLKAYSQGVPLDDPLATKVIREQKTRAELLTDAGLVHKRCSKKGRWSWRLTDLGRGVVAAHVPVFLHRRGFPSYTHIPHRGMHREPEVAGEMNPDAASTDSPKRCSRGETLRESLAEMKARNAA